MKRIFILSFFIFNNILFGDVVNSIVGIVGSMPITYEDFISRRTFLTLQAKSIWQNINDDLVYKDLVEERIMYLKLQEYNYTIEENDVSRRLDSIAKQYNMTLEQFSKQFQPFQFLISFFLFRIFFQYTIAICNFQKILVFTHTKCYSEINKI